MLKRKFYQTLMIWKNAKDGKCLLVKGARQVGKTTLIEKFAKDNYENFVELDFRKDPSLRDLFSGDADIDTMTGRISLVKPESRFIPGKTLLLLDEIQDCPQARASLKYWALDNRFDVIGSGSLSGVSMGVSAYPVGYERQEEMFALDFEEFLWAIGVNDESIGILRPYLTNGERIPDAINKKMFDYIHIYMITGGMPAVVNKYLETHNFKDVDDEQNTILSDYRVDIASYADASDRIKAKACFDSVPRQLLKDNHKFQYKVLRKGSTASDYMNSFDWLEGAGLITRCYNVTAPIFPIKGYIDNDKFRVYMNDIGLLIAAYGYQTKAAVFGGQLYGNIKGAIYENLIADFLIKKQLPLIYYVNQKGTLEIEFLLEKDSAVIPVEVKAGNTATASLNNTLKDEHIPFGYKFITGNAGRTEKKVTLPLYMAMFL